jgi:hypothetical protein
MLKLQVVQFFGQRHLVIQSVSIYIISHLLANYLKKSVYLIREQMSAIAV